MIKLNELTKKRSGIILYLIVAFCFLSCSNQIKPDNLVEPDMKYDKDIEHGIVFYEEGRYGGWPANHGIWDWENEILVGFIEADYLETEGFHTYDSRTARSKYARSTDGGNTWEIEDAYERGQTGRGADHNIPSEEADEPEELVEGIADFTDPDFIFTFLRHNNNDGPSHFYYSNNRGKQWEGPYDFPNLGTTGVASRTDYIVYDEQEMGAFLTIAKSNSREGRVIYAKTYDGAVNWEIESWVCPEHGGFDIMPSSVQLSPNELITTIRIRTEDRLDLITAYYSDDDGRTWERLRDPVADTGQGGSPPALVQMDDGRLALGYIYRSKYGSRVNVRFSSDNGKSWSQEIMLRGGDGANGDAGYPRMVQRPDGKLVMIYYWNNALVDGAEPYRYIAYTIFDPDNWE